MKQGWALLWCWEEEEEEEKQGGRRPAFLVQG